MEEHARIRKIRYEGADGSVLRVSLEDDSVFLLEADHPVAIQVLECRDFTDLLDGDTLEALTSADEFYRCYHKATNLLARAEQCRRGLMVKLLRKGWSHPAVTAALDRLENSGFLDDQRYAESWTRSRLRSRPEGSSRLIGGLMSKGVNGTVAREAVEAVMEELGEDAAEENLERAWTRISRRSGITEEKMIRSLVRLGFPISRVRAFLAERSESSDGESTPGPKMSG